MIQKRRTCDIFARERLARKFTKGLKIRFRTHIRKLGFKDKMHIYEMRDKSLLVYCDNVGPIDKFDGRDIKYVPLRESELPCC